MAHITRDILVAASRDAVWSVIADLESVATWNPGVATATCGPVRSGVGATRTCELVRGGRITEIVATWVPGESVWFAIEGQGAIRSADMGLLLSDESSTGSLRTKVEAVSDYHLAFGPLGPVIDHLQIRRLMALMAENSLAGLKAHVETGS